MYAVLATRKPTIQRSLESNHPHNRRWHPAHRVPNPERVDVGIGQRKVNVLAFGEERSLRWVQRQRRWAFCTCRDLAECELKLTRAEYPLGRKLSGC